MVWLTLGNFAAIATLTSETFASVLTSTVTGKPRASDPVFPTGEIFTETIVGEDDAATSSPSAASFEEARKGTPETGSHRSGPLR